MRLIDADAFDTILENGEIEAKKQRKYVLASAINTVRGNLAKQSSVFSSNCSEIPNNWIPCTPKTMPKKDGEYLVTFEEGYADDYNLSLVGIAPFEVDCEGFGFWQEHFDFASMGSLGSDWEEIPVVAWQPLPSPYREEADE